MELKNLQEELKSLKNFEEITTIQYMKRIFGRHKRILDLSNHFIFDTSCELLCEFIKSSSKKRNSFKTLVFKNCMLQQETLQKLLECLTQSSQNKVTHLDLGNNRMKFNLNLCKLLSVFLSRTSVKKAKVLNFQGNILEDPQGISGLFSQKFLIQELCINDTNFTPEALSKLSEFLSENYYIKKLDLRFNSEAFEDSEVMEFFGRSIANNSNIEHLDLSGNHSFADIQLLTAFIDQAKSNRSLMHLGLASIGLGDKGLSHLVRFLLNDLPLSSINLENNGISAEGLSDFIEFLPWNISGLDLAYNTFEDVTAIQSISKLLIETRSLKRLNISHTIEIEDLHEEVVEELCYTLTHNDTLNEFLCEGVKIAQNPDEFCLKLNEAISCRKLSLTYKIAAVNCFEGINYSQTKFDTEFSREGSPLKIISNVPSVSPFERDELQTDRKQQESPLRNSEVKTSRQYYFETP